ncbi:MAG TPA: S8 family serine peptidase, partial [Thermoanaerobaculia bacterium]|nr:S8 family serine peptidase [Thermoanaerobaculia bacterium]
MADERDEPSKARAPEELAGQDAFEQRKHLLDRSVIAVPLLEQILRNPRKRRAVIVDVDLDHPGGTTMAKARVVAAIEEIAPGREAVDAVKTAALTQYVVATLSGTEIRRLVRMDREWSSSGRARCIHRIWPDFPLEAHITRSVRTVKCDAARIAYSALGEGITWAVMDSGIDGSHVHFVEHRNLSNVAGERKLPWAHQDFTGGDSPLTDDFGHGTHVAGILAGEVLAFAARRPADAAEPAGVVAGAP